MQTLKNEPSLIAIPHRVTRETKREADMTVFVIRLTLVAAVLNCSLKVSCNVEPVVLRIDRVLLDRDGHSQVLLWNSTDNKHSHRNHRRLEDLWVGLTPGGGSSDDYYSV
jgi:hypothetical protein